MLVPIVNALPPFITVAAEFKVRVENVVDEEPLRSVGVPDAEVAVTVDVPAVKEPEFVNSVPDVPVRVMVEARAV